MKKSIAVVLALLLGGALSGRAAGAKENWSNKCAKCHGENGAGKTRMGLRAGVKDCTDAKAQAAITDEEMARRIKEGKKEGNTVKMPAFGDAMSDAEIKALVAHVRKLKK